MKVGQLFILDESSYFLLRNLGLHVCLVSYEDEHGVGVGVALDLVYPIVLDVLKGLSTGQIEDHEDCV